MEIQPLTTSVMPTLYSSTTPQAPATAAPAGLSVADTVTLSPAAQALLDGGPAPDASAGIWGSETVKRAIAALDGAGSPVGDRIDAFLTMTSVIGDAANFETPAQRAASVGVTAAFLDSAQTRHFQNVFDGIQRHIQQTDVYMTPDSLEDTLKAFDALSSDDQQTYLTAANLFWKLDHLPVGPTGQPFTSTDSFRANLTAMAGVSRELNATLAEPAYAQAVQAELSRMPRPGEIVSDSHHRRLEALASAAEAAGDQRTVDLVSLATTPSYHDGWTARAEAHFATFGPPPANAPRSTGPLVEYWSPQGGNTPRPSGTALAKALATINDRSGATSLVEQARAFGTVNDYLWGSREVGPLKMTLHKNVGDSGIYPKLWAAEQRFADEKLSYFAEMDRRAESGEELMDEEFTLRALNRLSASDQEFYVSMYGVKRVFSDSHPSGQMVRFTSLEAFKADLTSTLDEGKPIYERVRRAKAAAKAESGNRTLSDEQFTLNWMNKLSKEDQEFVFYRRIRGGYSVGAMELQPSDAWDYPTLAEYKNDLKRKADAKARQAAAKEAVKEVERPRPAEPKRPLQELAMAAPGTLNASIALQVLTRAAQVRGPWEMHSHGWPRAKPRP